MSIINIHGSYFFISNPLQFVDRWFNPFRYQQVISLDGKPLTVDWTHRAEQALLLRDAPLIIEMQLYFSCVVKKRLIFHDDTELATLPVNEKLKVAFRPVEALSCDPVEFARHYPVKRQFKSAAAIKMHPSLLQFDFNHQQWRGSFHI